MISMPGHKWQRGTPDFPVSGNTSATVGDLIEFLRNAIDKGLPLDTPLEFGCERGTRDREDFDRLNPEIKAIEWFVHGDIPAGHYGRNWLTIVMEFARRDEDEPDTEEADFSDEPCDGDLVTYDYEFFYELGSTSIFEIKLKRGYKVRVSDSTDWRDEVREYMDSQNFWPNVYFVSDHGNVTLLSLEDDE
jgi:hypothetical protein